MHTVAVVDIAAGGHEELRTEKERRVKNVPKINKKANTAGTKTATQWSSGDATSTVPHALHHSRWRA